MDDQLDSDLRNTILLVDDDQFIDVAYKNGLESAGYSVSIARDGDEALDILKSSQIDLMILELIIPKLNGFELLQKIKKDNRLKDLPIIVLTNLSQDSDEAEARSYGIVDFMVKSNVSLIDIIERIQEVFGNNSV